MPWLWNMDTACLKLRQASTATGIDNYREKTELAEQTQGS